MSRTGNWIRFTHLSTNRVRHRLTSLIETNALPLRQAATRAPSNVLSERLLCYIADGRLFHSVDVQNAIIHCSLDICPLGRWIRYIEMMQTAIEKDLGYFPLLHRVPVDRQEWRHFHPGNAVLKTILQWRLLRTGVMVPASCSWN